MKLNDIQVLQDFSKRMRAHSNGVLALFRKAGIEADKPTLADLHRLSVNYPDIYNEVIEFLYQDDADANADGSLGWLGWANAGASALSGFFSALTGASSGASDAEKLAVAQAQAQAQAAQNSQRTLMFIIGAFVLVVIVAVIVIFIRKRKG
jgi:hypothetical protein